MEKLKAKEKWKRLLQKQSKTFMDFVEEAQKIKEEILLENGIEIRQVAGGSSEY